MELNDRHLKVLYLTGMLGLLSASLAFGQPDGTGAMNDELPDGWLSYNQGNIVHGPGSYFLDDDNISRRFEDIQSH
ncbi:MAG: hypothetical protein VX733_09945, partial [Candidatus Latescibacterota bacterium]|nr:hypothetical protein [Candidatus Latescibacterota bacterium]